MLDIYILNDKGMPLHFNIDSEKNIQFLFTSETFKNNISNNLVPHKNVKYVTVEKNVILRLETRFIYIVLYAIDEIISEKQLKELFKILNNEIIPIINRFKVLNKDGLMASLIKNALEKAKSEWILKVKEDEAVQNAMESLW